MLLGVGDGSFQTLQTFDLVAGIQSSVLADFDGDGKLDLALSFSSTVLDSSVKLLSGNGDGTFKAARTFAVSANTRGMTAMDIDGDGRLDVVVPRSSGGPTYLLGNGDGTFQTERTLTSGPTYSLAVGDFDGDGGLDLIGVNPSSKSVGVMRSIDGRFGPTYTIDQAVPTVAITNNYDYTPTSLSSITFTVTFSEAVTGVELDDFHVTTTGALTVSGPLYLSQLSSTRYVVTVTGIVGNGTVALNLRDDGDIRDIVGNKLSTFTLNERISIISGGATASLATGDVTGDGIPDLATVDYLNNQVVFLVGNGDGSFQAPQSLSVLGGVRAVALGDVNGDGKLDLVINNTGHGWIDVLLGNGNGTFQTERTNGTPGLLSSAAPVLKDFNGDGKLDIFLPGLSPATLNVLLGNGDGTFQAVRTSATVGFTFATQFADFNGDGNLDVITINSNLDTTVGVALGNGDGTFQARVSYAAGFTPSTVAVADFNGDGKVDVVVSGSVAPRLMLGNGDGTLQAPTTIAGSSTTASRLVAADFNADGAADLVYVTAGSTLGALYGNGDGTFQIGGVLPVKYDVVNVREIALGNLVGDAGLDVVFSYQSLGYTTWNYGYLRNAGATGHSGPAALVDQAPRIASIVRATPTGERTNAATVSFTVTFTEAVSRVDAADFIAVTTDTAYSAISVTGSGSVYTVTFTGVVGSGSLGLALVSFPSISDSSFNGVYDRTVIGANEAFLVDRVVPKLLSIQRATPSGSTTGASTVSFTATFDEAVTGVDATDFRVVTSGTIAFGSLSLTPVTDRVFTITVAGIVGNGTVGVNFVDDDSIQDLTGNHLTPWGVSAGFVAQSLTGFGTSVDVKVGDVNGDGKLDIVAANSTANSVTVFLGNGDGTFQARKSFAAGNPTRNLVLGDVNGDGKLDIITTSSTTAAPINVLLGNGDGTFQARRSFTAGSFPGLVALADVNGDGKLDLAVNDSQNNAMSLWLGNGDGTFLSSQTFAGASPALKLFWRDMNGDGKLDLVSANASGTVNVYHGNGDGTFQARLSTSVGSIRAIELGDLNGDGTPDLITRTSSYSTIAVRLGNGDGTFQTAQTYASANGYSLAIADFDGDGKTDVLSGATGFPLYLTVNAGNGDGTLNEAPQNVTVPGLGRPLELGDFNADGRPDFATPTGTTVGVVFTTPRVTATGQTYTIDQIAPRVTSIVRASPTGAMTNSATVSFTVTFSEGTTGVDAADFAALMSGVTSSGLTVTAVSDTVYTVTIDGLAGSGTLGLGFAAGYSIQDLVGNALTNVVPTGTNQNYTVDRVAPQAVSIVRTTPTTALTGASSVTYTVTFSETVTGVDASDFMATVTGLFIYTPTVTALSGTVYTVLYEGITGQGTLELSLVDDGTIRDTAGNRLASLGSSTAFRSQQTFAVGSSPSSLLIRDLNGDGFVDLINASSGGTVSILLGNGDGTFQAQQTVSVGGNAYSLELGDLNGDGKLDLAATIGSTGTVSVLLGNGNGTFQARQSFTAGEKPEGIVIADINGDGKLDLVTANRVDNALALFLGNGNGTFQARQTLAVAASPQTIISADFNGDGKADLAVTHTTGVLSVLRGNGNGTFGSPQTYLAGLATDSLTAQDLDLDGKLDLLFPSEFAEAFGILSGNGDGTFKPQRNVKVGGRPTSTTFGDIDQDGIVDIVAVQSGSISIAFGNTDYRTRQIYVAGSLPESPYVQDINGDGKPDIIVLNNVGGTVGIYIAAPTLRGPTYTIDRQTPVVVSLTRDDASVLPITASTVSFTATFSENVTGVDAADFAIIAQGVATSSLTVSALSGSVYRITVGGIVGSGSLGIDLIDDGSIRDQVDNRLSGMAAPQTYGVGTASRGSTTADFNNDGKLDLVVANYFGGSLSLLLGNGDGTFQSQLTFAADIGPLRPISGDFNADGFVDVVVSHYSSTKAGIFLGNGNGTFQAEKTFTAGTYVYDAARADLNGDGKLDLVFTNDSADRLAVMLGNGNGTFQAVQTFASGQGPRDIAIADYNGDGKLDLVVANTIGAPLSIFLGNGNGTFQLLRTFGSGRANTVAARDLNNDGLVDLAVGDLFSGTIGVYLGVGGGTFQSVRTFAASAGSSAIDIGDLNGDGKLDVVSANKSDNSVTALFGNGDGTFRSEAFAVETRPYSVSAADFNGDGRTDIVATSTGGTVDVLLGQTIGRFVGPKYAIARPATTIAAIYARGVGSGAANWNASFLSYLSTNNLGDASLGYLLSTGGTQLKTLPWSNVNTISIRFTDEVAIAQSDLSVIGSANGPALPAITGFSWDSATHTGTWTFATALPRGKFLLHVADTVLNGAGHALDGEWAVSSSTQSGNGTAGGDFNFRFNVLPGDFDGNNGVTITEVLAARNRAGKGTASVGYAFREDIDGNGNITITEVLQSRNRTATSITGLNEPVAPGSTPQSPAELAPLIPGEEDGLYASPYASLTEAELQPIVDEAIRRWEASGLVPQEFDWSQLRFAITDLGPAYLGLGNPDGSILLDDDGAGWGWFLDSSPTSDDEFASSVSDVAAATHMDLLTVVMHEIGHALGYPTGSAQDTPAATLMSELLAVGTRRTPGMASTASPVAPSDLLAFGDFDSDRAGPSLTRLSRAVAPSSPDYAIYALSNFTAESAALETIDESAKARAGKNRRTASV